MYPHDYQTQHPDTADRRMGGHRSDDCYHARTGRGSPSVCQRGQGWGRNAFHREVNESAGIRRLETLRHQTEPLDF